MNTDIECNKYSDMDLGIHTDAQPEIDTLYIDIADCKDAREKCIDAKQRH